MCWVQLSGGGTILRGLATLMMIIMFQILFKYDKNLTGETGLYNYNYKMKIC